MTEKKTNLITELKNQLESLIDQIKNYSPDPDDYSEQYEESLDELFDTVKIGTLEYSPSYVLKKVDPIAYRCGLNDYVDRLGYYDDPTYDALTQEADDIQDEIQEMENQP